jgi:hypothetical protein
MATYYKEIGFLSRRPRQATYADSQKQMISAEFIQQAVLRLLGTNG